MFLAPSPLIYTWFCFVVIVLSVLACVMIFKYTHIIQGHITGTGAIMRWNQTLPNHNKTQQSVNHVQISWVSWLADWLDLDVDLFWPNDHEDTYLGQRSVNGLLPDSTRPLPKPTLTFQ